MIGKLAWAFRYRIFTVAGVVYGIFIDPVTAIIGWLGGLFLLDAFDWYLIRRERQVHDA